MSAAASTFGRICRFCGEKRDEGERFAVIAVGVGHGTLAPGYYPACPDCARESS